MAQLKTGREVASEPKGDYKKILNDKKTAAPTTRNKTGKCTECDRLFEQGFNPQTKEYQKLNTCPACRSAKGRIEKGIVSQDEIQTIRVVSKYQPFDWQKKVHTSNAQYKIIHAGSRTGKDLCIAEGEFVPKFIQMLNEDRAETMTPRVHAWIIAPTKMQTRQCWRYLKKALPREIVVKASFSEQDKYIETVNDGLIEIVSAYDPDALVGVGLDLIWLTEASRIADFETVWTNIEERLSSAGRGLNGRGGLALVNSSPKGRGYFYKLCQFGRKDSGFYSPNFETFHASRWDNPYEACKRYKRGFYDLSISKEKIFSLMQKQNLSIPCSIPIKIDLIGGINNADSESLVSHIPIIQQDKNEEFIYCTIKSNWYDIKTIYCDNEVLKQGKDWIIRKAGKTYEEDLKNRYSPKLYQENILGLFADESGSQFPNFRQKIVQSMPYFNTEKEKLDWILSIEKPDPNKLYTIGYDPAKVIDGAWVVVREHETNTVKKVEMFQNMANYYIQCDKLKALQKYYNNARIIWGITGMSGVDDIFAKEGLTNCEGKPEQGLNKKTLVEHYTSFVSNSDMRIYETDDTVEKLIQQHEDYGYKQSSNGNIVYSNMTPGGHDDAVSACYFAFSDIIADKDDDEIPTVHCSAMGSVNSNGYSHSLRRSGYNRHTT